MQPVYLVNDLDVDYFRPIIVHIDLMNKKLLISIVTVVARIEQLSVSFCHLRILYTVKPKQVCSCLFPRYI